MVIHSCIMMTAKELYVQTVTNELPIFKRVFEAVPNTNTDYKPDPKSKTAMEILATLAGEAFAVKAVAETGMFDFSKMPESKPLSKEDAYALLEKTMGEVKAIVSAMPDAKWDSEATLLGGKTPWKAPLGSMLWMFMHDAIHHRGQISTHLRAMGGKVPSIYGPSADSGEM